MHSGVCSGMNLFLLRHGIAVERKEFNHCNDAARLLTQKGKKQLRHVTTAMRTLELDFDLIFSSPLVRASQTAEIIAAKFEFKRHLSYLDELKPSADVKLLIQKIAKLTNIPRNLLLVGHEPDLSQLIALLVTGDLDSGFLLKKGGLAKLEIEKLRFGKCAKLAWLLTPAQMKLMR